MCGRFVYKGRWETLLPEFPELEDAASFRPNFNVAPTQDVPVLLREGGVHRLESMHWGLIPVWAKDASIGNRMINARAETVAVKPSFKRLLKGHRCLLLADGFFEWVKEGKAKTPYFIFLKDQPVFGMAGLWDSWKDPTEESIRSCTIITCEANDFMKPMHNRMPVILKRGDWGRWLDDAVADPDMLEALLKPYSVNSMACHPVTRQMNSPAFNSPVCIAPTEKDGVRKGA